MRIILIPVGSHGDVHPLVGLGETLLARGHDILVAVNPHFEPLVHKAGLGFIPIATEAEFLQILEHPDLWHASRAPRLIAHSVRVMTPLLHQAIRAHAIPGHTLVAGGSLAFAARIERELNPQLPLVTIHLQPSVILSVERPPRLPNFAIPAHWPRWAKRASLNLIHAIVDRIFGRPVNDYRAQLGLPPVRRIMDAYWHSPDLNLGLFPDWYGTPAPDWPPHFHAVGFPLYDESHHQPLPATTEAFLQAGEPPIAFTFGSAMKRGAHLFQAAASACARLNRRALFLARFEDQIPSPLPPSIHYEPYIPFSQVFPRCAAVVHHGGIGTTAQALAAGIPQVVVSLAHDQFDNGARVEALAVGKMLPQRRLNPQRLTHALQTLLHSPHTLQNARAIAARFASQQPLQNAADLIESLARARGIPAPPRAGLAGGNTPR